MNTSEPSLLRFQAALGSEGAYEELRDAVAVDLDRGRDASDVLGDLKTLLFHVRRHPDPRAENIILNVMDLVTGWCGPHARLPRSSRAA